MKSYIRRFVQDEAMFSTVEKTLTDYFLRASGATDVQNLAAERIIINKLPMAFRELRRIAEDTKQEQVTHNIAV